ncbi:MAG: PAS domain-containing protein [Vicinamibacteria bacterium]|nr:PAS domain-containing protein [Vicinamibacteria bacterium]
MISRMGKRFTSPFSRLFLAMIALLTLSELILGMAVYRRLRSDLERDLGNRLVHVSQLLATGIDSALVLQFQEGDEDLPAYELTRSRLARQAKAAGVEDAYVVDLDLRTRLDSRAAASLGRVRYGLLVNRPEVAGAIGGRSGPTRLYRDEQDRLRLSALTPLRSRDGAIVALVGVEATPEFFASLAALRGRMILLGTATLALALIGGTLLLRQTGRRLGRLRHAMSCVTHGDFTARAEVVGRDEIGALGRELDGLIASIIATRDYYEAVLGSLDVALVTTDAEGEIQGVNASAQCMLARDGETFVGRRLKDVLSREEALASFVGSALAAEGRPASAEIPLRGGLSAGGLIVAASAARLHQRGDKPGLVLTLLDVTELRALERRVRANERLAALGGMAGGLLHEVRNPLASMMLYLDLLRPLERSEDGHEILERAIGEGVRMATFLEDFQIFAALKPLRLEDIDACEVVHAAAASIQWPKEIRLAWIERAGARVSADRRLIEHAVRNLLKNALEALQETGGHVRVTVGDENGDFVIRVADDGPGIPGHSLERVLDPMFTTKSQGTGMGLSIVQRVVEAHGGVLHIETTTGNGAAFTIRLPGGER